MMYPWIDSTPMEGRIPSFRAKTVIIIRANQKFGMDTQKSAANMVRLSRREYWCVAAMTPQGIPIKTEITRLTSDIVKVKGIRNKI